MDAGSIPAASTIFPVPCVPGGIATADKVNTRTQSDRLAGMSLTVARDGLMWRDNTDRR